ncbi:dual specificity protein phosphatase 18 [Chrysoperla carnea]|uniref:dual specificity protein phosphatase 18 n=1 Tax=Chrysoperla carnea TaxID=189513 RepID=UPI001D07FA24|nr:dual specificity protein phosphatase 18 [Chrysoperla carnea]
MKTETEIVCIHSSTETQTSTVVKNRDTVVQEILHNNVPTDTLIRCGNQKPTIPGISEITDHLLLSSAAVLRPDILSRLGVNCVINATSELPDTPLPECDPPVIYLRVPVLDRNETDLTPYFELVADTIDQVRQSNGVTLVHCVAGISRSASLCLAYLMKYNGMTLRNAYRLVKSIRPQIKPNSGFMRQLITYEFQLYHENSVHFVYNEVTKTQIPDLYETDYEQMLLFQRKYKNACFIGRH